MFVDKTSDAMRRPLLRAVVAVLAVQAGLGLARAQDAQPAADQAPAAAATDAAPAADAAPPADAAPATEPQTVTEAVPAESDAAAQTTVIEDTSAVANPNAPTSYVVKRGDTLWGIAGMFLRDPWLWPEIWYVNPQVGNPHLIYPGDTLALAAGANGKQSLVLTRGAGARLQPLLRSQPLESPISTVPYSAIAAFLSKPGIISKEEAKAAPYIVSLKDNHLIAGAGMDVYVRNLNGAVGERFNVMHVGQPLKDPDGGRQPLGYMAVYAGTAQVARTGEIATATLTESAMETLVGDVLVPDTGVASINLVPHTPSHDVKGRIMAVVNAVLMVGQFRVVAINRGSDVGVDPGTVLRVNEVQQTTRDRCVHINGEPTCHHGKTELPLEASGTLLVFRSFPKMSYGLVVDEKRPIIVGDRVVNP